MLIRWGDGVSPSSSIRQHQDSAAGEAGTARPARDTRCDWGGHTVCPGVPENNTNTFECPFQANPLILLFDRGTLASESLSFVAPRAFRRPVASQAYFLPIYRSYVGPPRVSQPGRGPTEPATRLN